MTPLFQKDLSFRQVMAAASSLVCGYTEGAFSRVTSFNWYEDNNYKAFLGISGGRAQGDYTYDNSTSEYYVVVVVWQMTEYAFFLYRLSVLL